MPREESWEQHWGKHYDYREKDIFLRPLFEQLEKEKKIGKVVVDVGSGAHPVSAYLKDRDCKIITIDIAGTEGGDKSSHHIVFDIEKGIDSKGFGTKKTELKANKFLEINPRTEQNKKQVDTIIFSEVLNYIDFEGVIHAGAAYVKDGGRVIIINMSGRGFRNLFPRKGLKTNLDLRRVLQKEGFEIETAKPLGGNGDAIDEDDEIMFFVAVKKS